MGEPDVILRVVEWAATRTCMYTDELLVSRSKLILHDIASDRSAYPSNVSAHTRPNINAATRSMLMAESPSSRTSRTYMGGRLWFYWRANLTRNISYGESALRLVLKSKIDIVLLVVEDADWTQPTRIKFLFSIKLESPRLQATISLHGRLPHPPLALRNLLQKWSFPPPIIALWNLSKRDLDWTRRRGFRSRSPRVSTP